MATKSVVFTPAEKQVVLHALSMYETSLERAQKAAKDKLIADAYASSAANVRALRARCESGELEF